MKVSVWNSGSRLVATSRSGNATTDSAGSPAATSLAMFGPASTPTSIQGVLVQDVVEDLGHRLERALFDAFGQVQHRKSWSGSTPFGAELSTAR